MKSSALRIEEQRSPAEDGIWLFVLGDLIVFALFFITFMVYRSDSVSVFQSAQQSLNTQLGTANTLALLTSSWILALGVHSARQGAVLSASRAIWVSACLGLVIMTGKVTEYYLKLRAGVAADETDFFMFYFVFTGIHIVHVLIGLLLLGLLALSIKTDELGERHLRMLEGGAIYWHMVDLLWIVLFALFYLIG